MLHNIPEYMYRIVTEPFSFNNSIYLPNKNVCACTALDPVGKAMTRRTKCLASEAILFREFHFGARVGGSQSPSSSSSSFPKKIKVFFFFVQPPGNYLCKTPSHTNPALF